MLPGKALTLGFKHCRDTFITPKHGDI